MGDRLGPEYAFRTLILYQDYLVLSVMANGFNDFGGISIDTPDGPVRLNRANMRLDSDPGAWIRNTLDTLGALLDAHLESLDARVPKAGAL